MSFGIEVVGTKDDVAREVTEMNVTDNEQAQAARTFIIEELARMPDNTYQNGVRVSAHGHRDATFSNLHIEITQTRVALPQLQEAKVVNEFSTVQPAPASEKATDSPVPAEDAPAKTQPAKAANSRRDAPAAKADAEAGMQTTV
jgi:hypothetical protein